MLLKYISLTIHFYLGCVDTYSWDNGYGDDCSDYAKNWCQNGGAKPGYESSLGSNLNNPEKNCCACGKGKGTNQGK